MLYSNPLSHNAYIFKFRNVTHSLGPQGVRNSFVVDEVRIALSAASSQKLGNVNSAARIGTTSQARHDLDYILYYSYVRSCWKSKAFMIPHKVLSPDLPFQGFMSQQRSTMVRLFGFIQSAGNGIVGPVEAGSLIPFSRFLNHQQLFEIVKLVRMLTVLPCLSNELGRLF